MDIRRFFLNHAIKHQTRRDKQFHNYNDLQRVLLLFESDVLERNIQIKQLMKELKEDGKEVCAWGYADKKEVASAILRDYRVVGNKDFNILYRPKEDIAADLQRERFDLLIDLSTHDSMKLRYLALYANADFKAGLSMGEEPYIHDFMLQTNEPIDDVKLFDQIVQYLKTIKRAYNQ